LSAVEVLVTWAGAKAAAPVTRRESAMLKFMVLEECFSKIVEKHYDRILLEDIPFIRST
jgi:hypothetical protein